MDTRDLIFHEWDHYTLTIDTDKGPVSVKWKNVEELAKYATLQSGIFGGVSDRLTKQTFFNYFQNWSQREWDRRFKMQCFQLNDNPTIIDVGSGIAVVDLLLYRYLPTSKFYLVDKDAVEFERNIFFSENYPFYNQWAPVRDAIDASEFDASRFVMQGPDAVWPESDCITSYYSWCFHYPKETYWQKTLDSLKIGGKLILDIRYLKNKDVVGEISEEFKCDPIVFEYANTIPKWIDDFKDADPSILGHRCVWTRNC
jgi:hypothetical protein